MRRDKAIKYFKLAQYQANLFSKDPNTKVGSIFLAPGSLQILTCGYNGFPRGVDETKMHRWERPQKYCYCEHSERNGIYNACRQGTPLEGCIAVVTLFPCCDCARALIQVGVSTIVTLKPDLGDARWGESFKFSMEMFQEVGMQMILLDKAEVNDDGDDRGDRDDGNAANMV